MPAPSLGVDSVGWISDLIGESLPNYLNFSPFFSSHVDSDLPPLVGLQLISATLFVLSLLCWMA